jgi:hypothetical protein
MRPIPEVPYDNICPQLTCNKRWGKPTLKWIEVEYCEECAEKRAIALVKRKARIREKAREAARKRWAEKKAAEKEKAKNDKLARTGRKANKKIRD